MDKKLQVPSVEESISKVKKAFSKFDTMSPEQQMRLCLIRALNLIESLSEIESEHIQPLQKSVLDGELSSVAGAILLMFEQHQDLKVEAAINKARHASRSAE